MKINWFPGHMKKTTAEIKEKLKFVDVVIYVLDARAPISSINPLLSKLAQDKPILYVINKIDLADSDRVNDIAIRFKNEKSDYCIISSTNTGVANQIKQKINKLASAKIEKMKNKGIRAVVRAIVIGVPNSGKSTLINCLCGKAKTVTGNRAGVTKSTQWVSIGNNIELCDTPGTLYPNLENQDVAKKLLFIGSIKEEIIVDKMELALDLIRLLEKNYKAMLVKRYGEDLSLEAIARARSFVVSGGELDVERAGVAVLEDFKKCRIGKITLD